MRKKHPSAAESAARKMQKTIFITGLLEEDLNRFPLKSGAIARSVYTNANLSELQATTEKVVGGFLADDGAYADAATPATNEEI
ncbi:hypothetical protein BC628DRAFT_1424161 [Trametes gibbosa]|nr:hypothetical protein BC628DRAFT_1424388 [Trametes gibbosa]KAI0816947.1 hypothetical protein BC628DRAFT_1424161 [Trametes gibbosa]